MDVPNEREKEVFRKVVRFYCIREAKKQLENFWTDLATLGEEPNCIIYHKFTDADYELIADRFVHEFDRNSTWNEMWYNLCCDFLDELRERCTE